MKTINKIKLVKSGAGFTLIELLVVIAVISLLASVVLVALNSARSKGRDAKRLSDMAQLQKALELYYDKNNVYPGATVDYGEEEAACGSWDTSNVDNDSDGKAFIEPLVDDGIAARIPNDPSGSGACIGFTYRYYRYNAGDWGCDASKGSYYILGVSDMETSNGVHPSSPGFNCSGRDWHVEFPPSSGVRFEWVTGKFQK